MSQSDFSQALERYADIIADICASAHALHDSVNQTYGRSHPYGYHLDMVADAVRTYGHLVCESEDHVLPILFGAYYHDSIEDARLTYSQVTAVARRFMSETQAYMAAEIVYALTNDKGRTRAERAGKRYYQGIRATPYAPFVKLADRLANVSYSCAHAHDDEANRHMCDVYRSELSHFLESISPSTNFFSRLRSRSCSRSLTLPQPMISALHFLLDSPC